MQTIMQHLLACIRQGQAAALAMVIARKGSLPMAKRANLLVCADGTTQGAIGGGKLEADVIQAAQHVIHTGAARVMTFELTAGQIETDGLTCGGAVSSAAELIQVRRNPRYIQHRHKLRIFFTHPYPSQEGNSPPGRGRGGFL